MIYTRNGDDGKTSLKGVRISKASLHCEVLGSFDELNALMGLCKVKSETNHLVVSGGIQLKDVFENIQNVLFIVQASLAGYDKPVSQNIVLQLESCISAIETSVPMPQFFVMAGGSELAVFFDYVRTVVRRVERVFVLWADDQGEYDASIVLMFLNRLSSFMFCCARFTNFLQTYSEKRPSYLIKRHF